MTTPPLPATLLDPLGAELVGVDLRDLDDAAVDALRDLLADRGVVVLRDQQADDAAFTAFLGRLGDLAFTVGETAVEGHPDLNLITNVGRDRPPRSSFHVDTSYVRHPPAYTALRAVEVPAEGGHTEFSDQRRALDQLPEDLRAAVEGRSITHVVTGLELDDDAETEAVHPIVRPHPRSGRPSLYLSTAARCAHVSGLDDAAAAELVAALLDHSTQAPNVLRHRWRAGDVVIWDNACVLHRADHSEVVGARTMHRGMVAASGYAAA